jgi:hypothetical protein
MTRTILMMMMGVVLTLGVFCAAMFAEPAVTKVEEVHGLVHLTFPLLVLNWRPC